jgi:hypothetical protein
MEGAIVTDTRAAAISGNLAIGALYVWILAEVGLLLVATDFVAGDGVNVWFATSRIVGVTSLSVFALSLVTAVFCFVWIYRAMVIAHYVTPTLSISPRAAVGWFFVPIASLWKPYEAIGQIIDGSGGRRVAATQTLAGWWWAGWLVRAVLGLLSRFGGSVGADGTLGRGYGVMLMVGAVIGIPMACLFQEIIRRVVMAQNGAVEGEIFA